MKKRFQYNLRAFTLVEIMIAMAILVIMMGFLFQFARSGQRIWSASTKTSAIFDTAQIVFDVIETDLKNSIFSDEAGKEIPFYLEIEKTTPNGPINLLTLGMISNFTSSKASSVPVIPANLVGTYPVLYHFNKSTNLIYRWALESDDIITSPWDFFGRPFDSTGGFFSQDGIEDFLPNPDSDYIDILAYGVEEFDIKTMPDITQSGTTAGYVTSADKFPKAVKITLSLYDPEADKLEDAARDKLKEETSRTFTKIIFLE